MSQRAYEPRSVAAGPAAVDAAPQPEVVPAPDETAAVEEADGLDPYRYGWRECREMTPDGSERLAWSPLTYHDLLDPQEGDVVAESTIHRRVVEGVADLLTRRYEDVPDVAVWCNLKIVFRIPGLTSGPGPDICVVGGVEDRERQRKSFRFGREPGKVRLVVEVVSEESVRKDYRDLLDIYSPLGVEDYVAIRPVGLYPDGPFELRGWRLDPRTEQLRPIAADEEGRIPSLATGLLFGTGTEGWGLSLWDAATGERLHTSGEDVWRLKQRAAQAEEQAELAQEVAQLAQEEAELAKKRAERAEQRAREMAAELEDLRKKAHELEGTTGRA